jgi:hypothetical protein
VIELCYVIYLCRKMTTYCVLLCEDNMDCHCDLYVLNLNCYWFAICMCPILGAPHPGRQPKQGLYIKNQHIPRLNEERIALYSSINQEIYRHVASGRVGGPPYIRRLRVTEEYISIYSSVICNR